ncbi:MAG TPA: tRNA pseudouridine(55) synthase TruB [Lachnospiraceae bacterium]|nr:tRNA pseudouridine(55) synthase TruB [Lachnospiraceae bacterium]
MKDGIINIYKERGFTSHDVVAKLRGILKQKKIGHTGTLDPEAEGVLPVCLGKGTRLCDLLTDRDKTYETVLLLGQSTDTQDTTGTVLKQAEVSVREEQVREAVMSFVGEYAQVPPMYSALKVNGQKLCDLARAGKVVERKPRLVRICRIEILDMELPRVRMSVSCSKGTYIRTLCHDIGEKLGCHGCMEHLIRTRSGIFDLQKSITLSEVEKLRDEGRLDEMILAVDEVFKDLAFVTLKEERQKLGYNGNPFKKSDVEQENAVLGEVRVYDQEGRFIGIYRYDQERHSYRPVKMFYGK